MKRSVPSFLPSLSPLLPGFALTSALTLLVSCTPGAPLSPSPTAGDDIPEAVASGRAILEGWQAEGEWLTTTLLAPDGATRAGFLLEVVPTADAREIPLQARGDDGGPFRSARFTWVEHPLRVARVDLGRVSTFVEVRVRRDDAAHIALLTYSAVVPEDRAAQQITVGLGAGQPVEIDGLASPTVRQGLSIAGVQPRSAWGARPTLCTSLNETKTKISVHHTVTPTTTASGYEPRLRAIQNYHMDSNGWCDVGYHFLMTSDGTAWEAREAQYLGAHVGGQNTNNLGVSFIGCFQPGVDPCTNPDFFPVDPPQEMIDGGGWLIGQLADHYGIPVNTTTVIGHRDNPGQSTSCPGDNLHDRLVDLRSIATGGGGGNPPPPPVEGTVQGVIWDLSITDDVSQSSALGARLPGATITVVGTGVSTTARDGDGYWSFLLAPGFYTLSATLDGFAPTTRDVQITAGGEQWASMGLAPVDEAVALTVVVYDASQGLAARVAGATVQATGTDPTQTDEAGEVELSLHAGSVTVSVVAEGFDPLSVTEDLVAGESPTLELGLTPAVVTEPDPEPGEPDPQPDAQPDPQPDAQPDPEPEVGEEIPLGPGDDPDRPTRIIIPTEAPVDAGCRCVGSGDADAGGPMVAALLAFGLVAVRRRRR